MPSRHDIGWALASVRDRVTLARSVHGRLWPTYTGHAVILLLALAVVAALLALTVREPAGAAPLTAAVALLKNPSARAVFALIGWYPVGLYGAKGDGATDDTTAVALAGDAALDGGVVLFRSGANYVISSVICSDRCSYIGRGAKITHKAGTHDPIFYWPQSPRVLINNLYFEGIDFYGEVNDVLDEYLRSAIFLIYGNRVTVRDCRFFNFRSAAVHCQDVFDVTYDNLVVEACSNGWNVTNNGFGRNALEVLGTATGAFADQTYFAAQWTIRNCKCDMAGASFGGASGIVAFSQGAKDIRCIIDGCWSSNAVNGDGFSLELGWARDSAVTNNKALGCKSGIGIVDTSGGKGLGVIVADRVPVMGNIVDVRNHTSKTPVPYTAGVAGAAVPPDADVPNAKGYDIMASRAMVAHNLARTTGTAYFVRGNAAAGVLTRLEHPHVVSNHAEICNMDAASSVWGFFLSYLKSPTIALNSVERAAGAFMKDAYYCDDWDGFTWEGNSSRGAGRNAVRLVANVKYGSFNGGEHIDPASNEVTDAILILANTCTDIHFGGDMRLQDTRGGGAQMSSGINATNAGARTTTGALTILGWTGGAIVNVGNMAADQRRLYCQDTAPKSFGMAGHRFVRDTAAAWAARTGTWTRGDRCEYSDPSAGGNIGEVITTSGAPGTSKTYGAIAA